VGPQTPSLAVGLQVWQSTVNRMSAEESTASEETQKNEKSVCRKCEKHEEGEMKNKLYQAKRPSVTLRCCSSNLRHAGACTKLTTLLLTALLCARRCLHFYPCLSAPINQLFRGSLSAQRNWLIRAMVYKHSRSSTTTKRKCIINLKYTHLLTKGRIVKAICPVVSST
jgi:hypothetical protein